MNRAFIFFVLFIYSLSVSGAAFHLHFCGGHLIHISLNQQDESECCRNEMKTVKKDAVTISKQCCHNEVALIKVSADHSHGSYPYACNSGVAVLNFPFSENIQPEFSVPLLCCHNHNLPPPGPQEIVIRNRNFRI